VSEVAKFKGKTAVYDDGETDQVDEVILCTGYKFSFPFFPEIQVSEDGDFVHDFYKGVFWLKNPNVAMAGAHRGILFLKLELAGKWLARDFMRPVDLKRWQAEYTAEVQRYKQAGQPLVGMFAKVDSPTDTLKHFADVGVTYDENYAKVCQDLFDRTWSLRKSHFFTYKTMKLTKNRETNVDK
jgi:trimethylamine monooxygenase